VHRGTVRGAHLHAHRHATCAGHQRACLRLPTIGLQALRTRTHTHTRIRARAPPFHHSLTHTTIISSSTTTTTDSFSHFRALTRTCWNSFLGRYNLGLAHKKLLAIDEALQCFLDLHSVLPTNAEVVYQLGHCYELLKDSQMACDWFRKLSHLIPNDPSVLVHLGTLFDLEGDKSNAFSYHYEASRIFPSDLHTVEWLGAYYVDSQAPLKVNGIICPLKGFQ
jgi:tetratricopeptide (TPR) repeat protein